MTDQTFGQYRLVTQIGSGGMGNVYKAIDTTLQREVAIKVLSAKIVGDPSVLERFRSEAVTLGRLSHPNIASVYSFIESGGEYLLVMELVSGTNLEELVQRDGPLSPKRACQLISQALLGLQHAHAKGVVHRDIKPSNLMVTEEGVVKLMDFGIAKTAEAPKLTREGKAPGTPEYMSPEQIQGLALDARSDLYSMGVVLFELLTGELPFHGDTDYELMRAHIETVVPSLKLPSSSGIELDRILQKALSKSPAKRYSSATEMRADVQKIADRDDEEAKSGAKFILRRMLWHTRSNPAFGFALFGLAILAVIVGLAVPATRVPSGVAALLLSATTLGLASRSHPMVPILSGGSAVCGLMVFIIGFVSGGSAPTPTPVPPKQTPVANNTNAPAPSTTGTAGTGGGEDIAAKMRLDSEKQLVSERKAEVDRDAAANDVKGLINDAESQSTNANNEHDSYLFAKNAKDKLTHMTQSLSAAHDALTKGRQALSEAGSNGITLTPDDLGKLHYDMALSEWFASEPFTDDLNQAKSELSQMTDPTKKADVSQGIPFLEGCLKKKEFAWPKSGAQLHTMIEPGGSLRIC
jgi:serine/threonine-protein kinase